MLSICLATNFPAHEFSYSPPYLQREPTFYSCLCLNRLAVVSNWISYKLAATWSSHSFLSSFGGPMGLKPKP